MNRIKPMFFWLLTATLLNTGCSGDDNLIFGPQQKTTYSGQFLDSAVANLDYNSPTQSGTTDAKGRFNYLEGELIAFAVGNVALGTAAGQAIVTPINLIPDSNSTTPEVQNITRFLLALDQDDDPRNGIAISPAVKSAAENWPSVDFSASDFDSKITAIVSEAGSIDGKIATLPNSSKAREHLEKSIYCAYSGGYTGVFSGSSSRGEWMLIIDSEVGEIAGVGSDSSGATFRLVKGKLSADSASSFRSEFHADTTTAQPTPEWTGNVSPSGDIAGSGNAFLPDESISLTGSRKSLTLPEETNGDIYRGTIQMKDGSSDTSKLVEVGLVRLLINDNTLSGKGYLYAENTEFDIPATPLLSGEGFNFSAAGKEFIGRLTGNSIIMGVKDLSTENIGGGNACKTS